MNKIAETLIEAVFGYTETDQLMGRRKRIRLMRRNADPWGRQFDVPRYAVLENNHILYQCKSLSEATEVYNRTVSPKVPS